MDKRDAKEFASGIISKMNNLFVRFENFERKKSSGKVVPHSATKFLREEGKGSEIQLSSYLGQPRISRNDFALIMTTALRITAYNGRQSKLSSLEIELQSSNLAPELRLLGQGRRGTSRFHRRCFLLQTLNFVARASLVVHGEVSAVASPGGARQEHNDRNNYRGGDKVTQVVQGVKTLSSES